MDYKIEKLNWLTTIFCDMPDTGSITTQLWVHAGSIYEEKKINWLSHFLEHMFFKWWERYPTQEHISQKLDSIGWDFGAWTGHSHAGYYVKSASDFFEIWVDVLSDMLCNARFPEDEMQNEKEVIIQEMKMYADNPTADVMSRWLEWYYWDTSYWREIIWTEQNVLGFSQKDLFQHKKNLYTLDNMVLVVSWKLENIDEKRKIIKKYFKNIEQKKSLQKPEFSHIFPKEKIKKYEKNIHQAHIVMSSPGYSLLDEDRYAAVLLWIILGWNMSSRLFQNIRTKLGLCYYISAWHSSWIEEWRFIIRAGLDKQKIDFWLEKIFEQLDKIALWDITQQELDLALGYQNWNFKMGIETTGEMNDFLGWQYMNKKKIQTLEEIIQWYNKVKLEQIIFLAKKLKSQNWYTYYII